MSISFCLFPDEEKLPLGRRKLNAVSHPEDSLLIQCTLHKIHCLWGVFWISFYCLWYACTSTWHCDFNERETFLYGIEMDVQVRSGWTHFTFRHRWSSGHNLYSLTVNYHLFLETFKCHWIFGQLVQSDHLKWEPSYWEIFRTWYLGDQA